MNRRRLKIIGGLSLVLFALFILGGGCQIIRVPQGVVDRIVVRGKGGAEATTITDPDRIQKVVGFVAAREWGWYKSWHTYPSPAYAVTFESGQKLWFVVWIGNDGSGWIGFRRGDGDSSDNLLKSVSEAERAELLQLLGV